MGPHGPGPGDRLPAWAHKKNAEPFRKSLLLGGEKKKKKRNQKTPNVTLHTTYNMESTGNLHTPEGHSKHLTWFL